MNLKRILILLSLSLVFFVSVSQTLDASPKFTRRLLKKQKATYEDVAQAAYMIHSGNADMKEWKELESYLKENGLVAKEAELKAEMEVNRGQASGLLCKAAKLKGGVLMRVFGATERYAYRELVFLKIAAPGNQRRKVQGAELLSMFDNLDRFLKEGKEEKKPSIDDGPVKE